MPMLMLVAIAVFIVAVLVLSVWLVARQMSRYLDVQFDRDTSRRDIDGGHTRPPGQ